MEVRVCDKCDTPTIVIDSRDEFGYIRRRRKCTSCGQRYTTVEILKEDFDKVNKNVRIIKEMAESFNMLKLSSALEDVKKREEYYE